MCCCGKPTINGEPGYRWNKPDGPTSVYPVNPPALEEGDVLVHDEPGRCGGLDSHCHHYRVVKPRFYSGLSLYVRHGGGDEHVQLSGPIKAILEALDSTARYWLLGAIYYAHHYAEQAGKDKERTRWHKAAAEKRIKVRKVRGADAVKVWIEPAVTP